jgi:5-oxopent-3-ene-1,2,5-tricarboxylate decarboxylase/2-hydroxyhepta-2,4-diene-1,7-dioate isomerase
MMVDLVDFDVPPYRLSGTVYGTLLNHRRALEQLGDAANQAPYKAAPKAPVLYVKPRNTLARTGDAIIVPKAAQALEVGAALGLVVGRTANRVCEDEALQYVAGYTVVADYSVPHDSYYRPSVRFKALDGSCPIGPGVVPRLRIDNPDALVVSVHVDDEIVHTTSTSGMTRNVARLLADVTEFMTLSPGDVLMLGVAAGAPRVAAGHRVGVAIQGIGRLDNTLVEEQA